MKYQLMGIGQPLIDYVIEKDEQYLATFHLRKGQFHAVDKTFVDELLKNQAPVIMPGCSCANALVGCALQQPVGKIAYIGKIGKDSNGRLYQEELKKHKVKPLLIESDEPTGRALTIVTADAERTFAVHLGASITLSSKELEEYNIYPLIEEASFFHVTAYSFDAPIIQETALTILKRIEKTKTRLSLDLADPYIAAKHRTLIKELLPKAYLVFANYDEARNIFGEASAYELVREFRKYARIAVLKNGKDGSLIYAEKLYQFPSYAVTTVDTTGAGDMYAGSVLYGLIQGLEIKKIGMRASFLAAKIVSQKGARLQKLPVTEMAALKLL